MSSTLRRLVYLCFIYTCIEGFVINLTYPAILPYLIKDGFILLAYVALITEQRPGVGSLRKLGAPILAFAAVMTFFMAMPIRVNMLSALVALKQRVFYIPLLYVGYYYTRSERDLYALLKVLAWTAIPTSLFGIYLFFAGPSALQSMGGTYAAVFYSMPGAAGATFWRVPGTFTSPGQFALYLLIQAALTTGVLFVPDISKRDKIVASAALVLSLGAMLASGTRLPLVEYALCVGLSLFYMGRLTRMGTTALVLYGVLAMAFSYFGAGVQDRVGSVLSQENFDRFRTTAFGQLFYSQMLQDPWGLGLGAATVAGRHFTDFSRIVFVESYFGVISAETGIFGLIACLWLMLRIVTLVVGNRLIVRRAPWAPLWYFTALLVIIIVALMPSSTVIDSAPGNMYFWFLLGVVVRLADMERVRLAPARVAMAGSAAGMMPYAYTPGPARP